jgi:hypothetical protein
MATLTAAERRAIADAAERVAEQYASEPLLTTAQLEQLTLDELDTYLRSRGVTIDWERITEEVRAAVGSDALSISRGQALSPGRMEDLEARSKRAVASAARSVANQTIGDMRQAAIDQADDRPDDEKYLIWVSVGGGCDDCRDLHGTIFRLDAWEGMAPRDGTTRCRGNCRCSLVPCASPGAGNEGTRV